MKSNLYLIDTIPRRNKPLSFTPFCSPVSLSLPLSHPHKLKINMESRKKGLIYLIVNVVFEAFNFIAEVPAIQLRFIT